VGAGRNVVHGLVNGINAIVGDIHSTVSTFGGKAQTAVSGAANWLVGAGRNVVHGIVDGINAVIGDIGGKVGTFDGRVVNAVKGAGNWLYSTGRDVVRGLINGIMGMGKSLANAVINLAKRFIPAPIRKALGISSPSRVMAEIGRWVPAGFAQGINANSGVVAAAVSNMANAASSTMVAGSYSASVSAPSGVYGGPTLGTAKFCQFVGSGCENGWHGF
jgi:phage-related protein